ncbi:MAG: replication initiator [Acidimicrobiales bacterium]
MTTSAHLEPPDLEDVLLRATDPEAFEAWRARAKATGWCRHPVRLVGSSSRVDTASGEVVSTFSSAQLPDRVLLKSCGYRRATLCPSCSATYQADAYQLLAAGLRGGKGVPDSVSNHPMVFATLTAPGFGAVHTSRPTDTGAHGSCSHRLGSCPHGHPRSCALIHEADDPALGQPLCTECFDYRAAVLWNAHAGELWRRTTIAAYRALGAVTGLRRAEVREAVRLSFSKVVEYQRRGCVHLHAVIRLDSADDGDLPPPPFDVRLLVSAVTRTVGSISIPSQSTVGPTGPLRWGTQLDVQTIGGEGVIPKVVAGYLAKYATKSTDPAGHLDRRLRKEDPANLDQDLSPHLARMVRTAWELGGRPEYEHLRLRAWAHTLGFRGHWLTKSRRYSTTFAALRTCRREWNGSRPRTPPPRDGTAEFGQWNYSGRGWDTDGDGWLVETAARAAIETRRASRLELRSARQGDPDGRP